MKPQTRYQIKYDRENTRSLHLKFHIRNDADILSKLDRVDSKAGYIKSLIRKDLKSE